MRAVAVFPKERQARLVDHPAPHLEHDTDARLRVLDVGVCGTDREIARFEYGTPPPGAPYLVIGHESLAEVVEVGRGTTRVHPGDLVVTTVRRPCDRPDCPACRCGRPDFCVTGGFTERGIKGRHGFMADEVVDDERNMHVVPRGLRDVAVLVEPLTIAEKGLLEVGEVQKRLPWLQASGTDAVVAGRAVVLGAGPVGLLGLLALRRRGFDTWVYSRESATSLNAKLVARLGGHYLIASETPIESIPALVGNVDLIYEATGAASISFAALSALGTNGVFIFTGVPGRKGPITLDADRVMRDLVLRNQIVYGTVNAGPDAFRAAVDDLTAFNGRWPDVVAALITSHSSPDDFPQALAGAPGGIKQVIRFAEPTA